MIDDRRVGVVHVHSDYSRDGLDSIERLREFGLERGLSFIGLTDHAEDLDEARFDDLVSRCRTHSDDRLVLVPGLEFRFAGHAGLHLLALGLRRWIAPATPSEFMDAAGRHAALSVVAHPVLPRYRVPAEVLERIDAIEVWNATYNTRYLPDPKAIRLLHDVRRRRPEVVGTAGLDQHDSRNDRGTRIVLDRGERDPLAAIRAGRFTNLGRTMSFDSAVRWGPARMAGMHALRTAFDRVERLHDRAVKAARRARAR